MTEFIWIILAVALSVLLLAIGVRCSMLADRSRAHRFVSKRFGTVLSLTTCQETRLHGHKSRFSSYWVAECVDDDDTHHRARCRVGFMRCELLEHEQLDDLHNAVPPPPTP